MTDIPIFKAAENKRGGGKGGFKTSPKFTLDYITRSDKAAIITSMYLNDSEDYAEQFAETKKLWNKAPRKNDRQYYHFIHSFSSYDDISPELAHQLTEKLCEKSFPHSEIVIATHTDTDHVHCHIVINAVNFDDGKKLQISPKSYTAIKDLSNELASEYGLTAVDFRKSASEPVRQSQAERQIMLKGGTSWKQELCEVIDLALRTVSDMEQFEEFLKEYGITLTRNTNKTIAYKHPQKEKAIRGEKLGARYTKGAILDELSKSENGRYGGGEYELTLERKSGAGYRGASGAGFDFSAIGAEDGNSGEGTGESEVADRYIDEEAERERERQEYIRRNRYAR